MEKLSDTKKKADSLPAEMEIPVEEVHSQNNASQPDKPQGTSGMEKAKMEEFIIKNQEKLKEAMKDKIEEDDVSIQDPESSEIEEPSSIEKTKQRVRQTKPEHARFNFLLNKYVSNVGLVDYTGLSKDIGKLDSYLEELNNFPIAEDWSRNEKLAYWINAYNAFTLKLILSNFPVKSITDIDAGKPWDTKWIKLDDKTYSLNMIENDIIRPRFNEPRIHFAVNCAAKSCPPLANEAFTAENIEALLDKQTIAFINDSSYNVVGKKSIEISKIFEWYGSDFGDVIQFFSKYLPTTLSSDLKVEFKSYDWSLNGK